MIGQRIVIHAGARRIAKIEVDELLMPLLMRDRFPVSAAETCLFPDKAIPVLYAARTGRLPIAAGIGTAIVGEPRNGHDIAAEFGVPRANDSSRDEQANWGWPMLEVEAWPEPIPMKGAQGLWNCPTPERAFL
ncbi:MULTISPECIES: hypothetical protein [unclassified Sphingomonas]|uniref:hypothetical protein n=1 Tax=unclassified Sphingomonas TaxID=196159 RepID=UPI0012E384F6|nr:MULTISPECIES: hypothetical protein [unclassified Sphingomonas]